MCRIVGSIGHSAPLADLLQHPTHSLYIQSYRAKELVTSVVSADGWGAAWYLPGDPLPCRYRSTLPIWADGNLQDIGRTVRSPCQLAYVRSATDPLSVGVQNTQPFVSGPLAFVHNGYVQHFDERVKRSLGARLTDRAYQAVRGSSDSEYFFALLGDAWHQGAWLPAHERLQSAATAAASSLFELAAQADVHVLLSFLVSDGDSLFALRSAQAASAPSLYVSSGESGVRVASEPLDDASGWLPLAAGEWLLADAGGVKARGYLSGCTR